MEQEILAIKRAILELEKNNSKDNESKILKNIDNIIRVCERLKDNFQNKNEKDFKNVKCSKINTITFIYKPLRVKNYFEGDYIVKFAEARSADLKEAKALDSHNEFWIQHKTIKGNIFGSVPKELLKEESVKALLRAGWREAEVDIYDIKESLEDIKEIISFCEETLNHYILIEEELTNTHLILHYKIV